MAVASAEINKNGNFKLAGMLNMKLKMKAASPAKTSGYLEVRQEPPQQVLEPKVAQAASQAWLYEDEQITLNISSTTSRRRIR